VLQTLLSVIVFCYGQRSAWWYNSPFVFFSTRYQRSIKKAELLVPQQLNNRFPSLLKFNIWYKTSGPNKALQSSKQSNQDQSVCPVVGLGLGGPEARLKMGPLMTSSYSDNRDNYFWSSLRYDHPRIFSWDYGMTDIAEEENSKRCSWYTTLKSLKVGKTGLATHKS